MSTPCPTCQGRGYWLSGHSTDALCPACAGTGLITTTGCARCAALDARCTALETALREVLGTFTALGYASPGNARQLRVFQRPHP